MQLNYDIPDELIRILGNRIVESDNIVPVACVEYEGFKISIRGSNLFVIDPFGKFEGCKYWQLPHKQAFYIYVCMHQWLWAADDVVPLYLGSDMSSNGDVQKWGEGEA